MAHRSSLDDHSGLAFTLLELVVTIALLAVMAGLIVPRMAGSTNRAQVHEAAARFAHTARTVRELAVSRHAECALEIDLTRGGYEVLMQSNSEGVVQMKTLRFSWLKGRRWPESVHVERYSTPDRKSATGGVQRLSFHPDGRTSGATVLFVCEPYRSQVVIGQHTGRIAYGDPKTTIFPPEQVDLGD